MSEFLAEAQILVVPNTKGFAADLKIQLEKATAKPVSVQVVPSTVGFAAALREQLTAIKTAPIPVKAVPITTGFKAALTTAINEIKATPVDVQIVPNVAGFASAVKAATLKVETTPVPVTVVPNTAGFAAALKAETEAVAATPVTVLITPDTAGFAALLREQTQAAARTPVGVPVVPEIAGFAAALRTETQAVTKTPVKVQVIPTTVGFTAAVREETQAIKVPPVKVLAVPDFVGFTAALRTKIADAAIAPVKVKAVPDVTGFAAALQTAVTEASSAVTATVNVVPNVAGGAALGSAAASGVGAQAASTEAAVNAAKKLTTAEAGQKAAEQSLVTVIEKYNAANTTRLSEDSARVIRARQLTNINQTLDAAEVALAQAVRGGNAEQIEAVQLAIALSQARKKEIVESRAAIAAGEAEASVQAQINAARDKAIVAQQAVIGATSKFAEVSKQLSLAQQAAKASEAALAEARDVGTASIIREAEAVHLYNTELVTSLAGAKKAERAAESFTSKLNFLGRGFATTGVGAVGLRGNVLAANGAFIAGAAAALALGKSVKLAADLASELNVFNVVANATASQMQRVAEESQKLGADISLPGVTAGDAAQALTELSKAGLSVQDSIGGARGVLQLATAAQIDNAEATQLAASALNAFGLAGNQAVHVADVLTNAANASQGSIEDTAIALQQAAAVARQVGISFEDTVNFLTQLARAGIKGSDAGTSLRVAFTRLINPTDKAQKILSQFNIKLRDAEGHLRPQIFSEFAAAQANLTKRQQDSNAAVVFGTDALRAYSIISRGGASAFTEVGDALSKQGSASQLANARMTGLTGQVANLSNQMSNLGLTVGKLTLGPLSALAKKLADDTKATEDLLEKLGKVPGLLADAVVPGDQSPKQNKEVDDRVTALAKRGLKLATTSLPVAFNASLEQAAKTLQEIRDAGKIDPALSSLREMAAVLQQIKDEGAPDTVLGGVDKLGAAFEKQVNQLSKFPAGIKKIGTDLQGVAPQIAKAFEDGIITPAERAALSSTELGKAIQRGLSGGNISGATAKIKTDLEGVHASIQASLGDLANQARGGVKNLGPAIASGIEDAARAGVVAANSEIPKVGKSLKANIAAAFFQGVAQANASAQDLEDAMNRAIISGAGPRQLNTILQKEFANQQKKITADQNRLGSIKGNSDAAKKQRQAANKIISDALAEQAQITGQIKSNNQTVKSDVEQKVQDIKKANNDADQAILDAFAPAEQKLDILEAAAQASGDAKKIIAAEKARRAQLRIEIKAIGDRFNDTKNAAAIISQKRVQVTQLTGQIAADTKAIFEAALQPSPALQAQIDLAQATGNIPQQINLNNVRIKQINALIKSEKATGVALNNLKTERENLKQQNEDLQNQRIQDQIALGQSIFDLNENSNPLLKALNAAIAETRADIAAAKKAGRSTVNLRTELNNFLKQRKDAIDEVNGKTEDATTAFDLLQQNINTFNDNAGTLINNTQPFAGPTGFTADVAQFLVRRKGISPQLPFPGKATDDKLVSSQTSLTDAIVSLTQAIEAANVSGNTTAGVPVSGHAQWSAGAWVRARQARAAQEARSGV